MEVIAVPAAERASGSPASEAGGGIKVGPVKKVGFAMPCLTGSCKCHQALVSLPDSGSCSVFACHQALVSL